MERIPVIIDTDPGYDDALALVFALGDDRLDIRAVTASAGNIGIERTYKNAIRILSFFGRDIPVGRGADKPLVRGLKDGAEVHSPSGLAGVEIPEDVPMPGEKHSVALMKEVIESSEEKITLVPIGPLTNIALLLSIYPELKAGIERIVIMGGSAGRGNVTEAAEFNIYADPEAAKIVFESGIKIVMAGLDVTNGFQIYPEDFDSYRSMGRTGVFVAEALEAYFGFYRKLGADFRGPAVHDMLPFAFLTAPELFSGRDAFTRVECEDEDSIGRTVVDYDCASSEANTRVLLECDREKILGMFAEAISRL